ncbi:MAG TPA: alpha/beta fold hydrolase [Acidocella sp.]|nr:alpha/beta fold hydrolase [Acidocella sp.]HQU04655.1 alpha/beta fold hydrolase [Acidocella sp.]
MKLDIITQQARGTKRGTVLFLHGAWCWHWYWQPFFMPYFARHGYDAVAFSLRGHGASEGHAMINSFSIGDYVRDLKSVVETLDNPLIIGHSMGGFVTQAYLAKQSARGAVLLASASPKPIFAQLFKNFLSQPFSAIRAGINQTVATSSSELDNLRYQMFSRGPEDRSMDQYLSNIQAESYRAVASMMTRGIRDTAQITTPIFVLGAGHDHLVPPDAVAVTAKTYKTEPVMFPEMSHMMMLEPRWRDVADSIIKFETTLPH